nr:protein unc-13 homolog [Ipomoea batatas]
METAHTRLSTIIIWIGLSSFFPSLPQHRWPLPPLYPPPPPYFSDTTTTNSSLSPFPSPFGNLTPTLTADDIRGTAYEIFVAACCTSIDKALTYIPSTGKALTEMKKTMGLRSSSSFKLKRLRFKDGRDPYLCA